MVVAVHPPISVVEMTEKETVMVDYWDKVSEAVLATASEFNITPQYVIEEFCIDSDFPNKM